MCAPLQKYQEFFVTQNEESTGFSKVALTIAWVATAFFAYPIFGLLAAIGVMVKVAVGQSLAVDPINMTDEQLQVWGQDPSVTTAAWNEVQMQRLVRIFDRQQELALNGKLTTSPLYTGLVLEENPWDAGGPREGNALRNEYFWLSGTEAVTSSTPQNRFVRLASGATEQGEKVEFRFMCQVGGENDEHNDGVLFVNCRIIQ